MESADTRERILAAAAELFLTVGYESTGMRDIASAAGVSVGSVYLAFASKRAVLLAIVADGNQRMMDEYVGPAAQGDGEPFERVLAIADAYFRFFMEERPVAKLMAMNALAPDEGDDPSVRALAEAQIDQFQRASALFAQLDLGPGFDPTHVHRWTWGGIFGQLVLNLRLPHLAVDDDELDRILGTGMRMLRRLVMEAQNERAGCGDEGEAALRAEGGVSG